MLKFSVRLSIVFLVLLVISAVAAAQPPLTLDAAIAEALARNTTLASERAAAGVAVHRPAQERALPPPMIDTQIWRWPLSTLNPGKVDMYMVGAEQVIPSPRRRSAAAALAEREAAVAIVKVAATERDIAAEVTAAYAELAVARRARALYADAVAAVRQLGEVSVSRYSAAKLGQQDVVKSMVEISRLHQELIELTERERRAEARLATLLGRSPSERIARIEPPSFTVVEPSASVLQAIAEQNVPELRLAQAEREVALAAVELAKTERKPDYLLRAGYMLTPGEVGAWTASAGITWPHAPWSRKRLDALEAEKRAAATAADMRVAEAGQSVAAEIQNALIALESARSRVELLRTTLIPQSNQSLEVSRIGYTAGQLDFIEVLDNHRVHLSAELEFIRAEGAVLEAAAALERAIGQRLNSHGVQAAIAAEEK